jgi:hypothetical protein
LFDKKKTVLNAFSEIKLGNTRRKLSAYTEMTKTSIPGQNRIVWESCSRDFSKKNPKSICLLTFLKKVSHKNTDFLRENLPHKIKTGSGP